MAPIISCKICQQNSSKYKCPTCLLPYCSLVCFKKHKEIPCTKEPEPSLEEKEEVHSTELAPADELQDERPYYVDDPSEVLQPSQFESIASSKEIQKALSDKQLQKILQFITSSKDAESELTKAMQDDSFRAFTEKVISEVTDSSSSS